MESWYFHITARLHWNTLLGETQQKKWDVIRVLWTALVSYFPIKINYALISLSSLGHPAPNYPPRGAQRFNAPDADVTPASHCRRDQLFMVCRAHAFLFRAAALPLQGCPAPGTTRFLLGQRVPLSLQHPRHPHLPASLRHLHCSCGTVPARWWP